MLPEFRNEPFTDFSVDSNAKAFRAALAAVEKRLPLQGEIRIGGKRLGAPKTFHSVNPCNFKQVIGRFPEGTITDASRAIDAATKAFPAWSRTPADERSALVLRIASAIRRRKHEFSAMMVLEESARPGPRPTATRPRRSTSASSTRGRCCGYAEPQPLTPYPGERNELASTSRSASAS